MGFCPKCGKEASKDASFCSNCGHDLRAPVVVMAATTAPVSAPSSVSQPTHVLTGYCVYEKKANREISNPHRIMFRNGQAAIEGNCATCGMLMFKVTPIRLGWAKGVVIAYCFDCKKLMEINGPKKVSLEDGQPAFEGACASCGRRILIADEEATKDEYNALKWAPATAPPHVASAAAPPHVAPAYAFPLTPPNPLQAYCSNCHETREIVYPKKIVQDGRPPRLSGTCAKCGGSIGRLFHWSIGPTGAVIMYCSHCMKEVEVRNPQRNVQAGEPEMRGTCSSCGKILAAPGDEPDERQVPRQSDVPPTNSPSMQMGASESAPISSPADAPKSSLTGYCVYEKAEREIRDPRKITLNNGRPAIKGTCASCGKQIFKVESA